MFTGEPATPAPDWNGEVREGDNLYSDSLLALDADSGKLRWHFQFTPHDVHDWDATQVPVLMEGVVRGKRRKLVLFANRNAFYYVLDRETGEFLQGRAYAKQTWAEGLDDHGRPMRLPNTAPTIEGVKIYPSVPGATNWFSPSYSPLENLFYVTTLEMGNIFHQGEAIYKTGSLYTAGGARTIPEEEPYSEVRAFEAETGKLKWAFPAGGRSRFRAALHRGRTGLRQLARGRFLRARQQHAASRSGTSKAAERAYRTRSPTPSTASSASPSPSAAPSTSSGVEE